MLPHEWHSVFVEVVAALVAAGILGIIGGIFGVFKRVGKIDISLGKIFTWQTQHEAQDNERFDEAVAKRSEIMDRLVTMERHLMKGD